MPGYFAKTSLTDVEFYLVHARRPAPRRKYFSQYRGVQKNSNPKKPYRVAFKYQGRVISGGTFTDEIEAAKAYNRLAQIVIGSHAVLNEIPNENN